MWTCWPWAGRRARLLLRREPHPARYRRPPRAQLRLRGHRQRGGHGAPQPPHHARRGRPLLSSPTPPCAASSRPGASPTCATNSISILSKPLLVVNRVPGELSPALRAAIEDVKLPLAAVIPSDPLVTTLDAEGKPLFELPDSSVIYRSVCALARRTLRSTCEPLRRPVHVHYRREHPHHFAARQGSAGRVQWSVLH